MEYDQYEIQRLWEAIRSVEDRLGDEVDSRRASIQEVWDTLDEVREKKASR